MTANILQLFNNHFVEFVNDIQSVFPEDVDILTAKNALIAIRKANPKLVVKIWSNYIVKTYKQQIDEGNIDFFINKDYTDDLTINDNANTSKIIESIDRLREPVKQMTLENQMKTMKYIQNLTKLSLMIPQ